MTPGPNNDADGRVQGRGAQITVPTSHSIFQQCDHGRAELSFRLCISTGEWALSAVRIAGVTMTPFLSERLKTAKSWSVT